MSLSFPPCGAGQHLVLGVLGGAGGRASADGVIEHKLGDCGGSEMQTELSSFEKW